jgi:hypothetical protein
MIMVPPQYREGGLHGPDRPETKVIGKADLDGMGCETPGCDHDHSILYLTAACHPNGNATVSYHKREGQLVICCSVCGSGITRIQL